MVHLAYKVGNRVHFQYAMHILSIGIAPFTEFCVFPFNRKWFSSLNTIFRWKIESVSNWFWHHLTYKRLLLSFAFNSWINYILHRCRQRSLHKIFNTVDRQSWSFDELINNKNEFFTQKSILFYNKLLMTLTFTFLATFIYQRSLTHFISCVYCFTEWIVVILN